MSDEAGVSPVASTAEPPLSTSIVEADEIGNSARNYFNALIGDIGVMLAHASARGILIPDDLAEMITTLIRSSEFRRSSHPRFGSHRS